MAALTKLTFLYGRKKEGCVHYYVIYCERVYKIRNEVCWLVHRQKKNILVQYEITCASSFMVGG